MISFTNSFLAHTLNSALMCNTDECLSFIIVFLNLLTIFYLVYSSYRKITKITRLFGYIWSCFIMVASVVVLALHTCVFTIAGTVFTGMAIIAVLSMIFESKKEGQCIQSEYFEPSKKDIGCYVIFPTTDNNFVFGLHNKKNELLIMSKYKYASVEEAKEAISLARTSGDNCDFEDLTKNWVVDAKHPKFRMLLKKQKYFFELAIDEDFKILQSDAIEEANVCLRMVNEARKCVTSNMLFFSTSKKEIKNGKKYQLYSSSGVVIEEKVEEDVEEYAPDSKSLAESFKAIENVKTSNNVNKQTLFEYMFGKFGEKVVLNRRENQTSTGLPLADTYYTYKKQDADKKKKTSCFAYVYEKNEACLILAKLDKEYAKSLKDSKKSIRNSRFPNTKTRDWYSVIVDDTFTEDEIHAILDNAKDYCEK